MKIFCLCLACTVSFLLKAQDSIRTERLQEVVITATRSERLLSQLPVPVTVVPQQQIRSMGSLRLNDVLNEQTGLTTTSDHGTGVQLQGFTSDYTLILIDGEPLIGRTAGTLELNRIAVGNIKQLEIVKGPNSSLYGSEALAGVINIITETPNGIGGAITSRYGTNQTSDFSGSFNFKKNKLGIYVFGDRYETNGYDLSPETPGNTVSPYTNYTYQTRLSYDLSSKTKLSVSGRYFTEDQTSIENVGTGGTPQLLSGNGSIDDWNINPVITHLFSDNLKLNLRFYSSQYETRSLLTYQSDGVVYDDTYFNQTFTRPELQLEYFKNDRHIITIGGGRIWESVEATRYDDQMRYQTNYAYAQYEWKPLDKLNLLTGVRFDNHSVYGSQLSPKLSAHFQASGKLSFLASVGVGFKAPDFRQLYLNFTNATVGYTVLGSQYLSTGINQLQLAGQIDEILVDPSSFGDIKAESSIAYNFGVDYKFDDKATIAVNIFRNDVKDLIDTKAVARKTNGQFVYSYYNISKIYTEGIEGNLSYSPVKNILCAVGYQFLLAKDKEVIDQLESGKVYARDPETQITRRVRPDEYGGLFNRSRHMLNLKVFYENPANGIGASGRVVYRGRYGFADNNSNSILDNDAEYTEGYFTANISVSKAINKILKLQLGCDNLFNYTDAAYIPALPGRLLWASLSLTFSKGNTQDNKN